MASALSKPSRFEALAAHLQSLPAKPSFEQAVGTAITVQQVIDRGVDSSNFASIVEKSSLQLKGLFDVLDAELPTCKGLRESANKATCDSIRAGIAESQATVASGKVAEPSALFAFVVDLPEAIIADVEQKLIAKQQSTQSSRQTVIVELIVVGIVVAIWKSVKGKRSKTEKDANSTVTSQSTTSFGGASDTAGVEVFKTTRVKVDPVTKTSTSVETELRVDPLGLLGTIAQLQ